MTSIIIILILLTQQNIEIFQHNYSNNISVQFLNDCQWPTGHKKNVTACNSKDLNWVEMIQSYVCGWPPDPVVR